MKVKQLIKKLNKLPQDSKVTFENTDIFNDGIYEVTEVLDMVDGTVLLESNYKKNYLRKEE